MTSATAIRRQRSARITLVECVAFARCIDRTGAGDEHRACFDVDRVGRRRLRRVDDRAGVENSEAREFVMSADRERRHADVNRVRVEARVRRGDRRVRLDHIAGVDSEARR